MKRLPNMNSGRFAAYSAGFLVALALIALVAAAAAQVASEPVEGNMAKEDLVREAKSRIVEVTAEAAEAMRDKGGTYFLDTREEKEFKRGHIPGAINIPRGWLEFRIADLVPEKDADIVIYCKSGDRSSLGVVSLLRMGYRNAVNLKGGWRAWDKAGYPVE